VGTETPGASWLTRLLAIVGLLLFVFWVLGTFGMIDLLSKPDGSASYPVGLGMVAPLDGRCRPAGVDGPQHPDPREHGRPIVLCDNK
jgi:hypothetical protein